MVCARGAIFAGVVGLALAGCQNNTIELDFDTDDPDASTSAATGDDDGVDDGRDDGRDDGATMTVGPTTATAGDDGGVVIEDGSWFVAIDTPLSPGLPFQFVMTVAQAEPGIYNLTLQSLSLDIGSTTAPRQLVGPVTNMYGAHLGPDVNMEAYTGAMVIPANANPVSGTELTVDLFLQGMPVGDPYCGVVSGAVVAPTMTDIAGSTFATVRIDGPANLPTDFPLGC